MVIVSLEVRVYCSLKEGNDQGSFSTGLNVDET